MNGLWARIGIAGVAAGVALIALRMFMLPVPPPAEDFTKTAYDENGNVLTGSPTIGQTIQYVLRYNPASTSGPVSITDVLSANQTYVPNTIIAPGWSISTPEYNVQTETYSHSPMGPTNFTLSIPAVSGTAGPKVGSGDGYEPVPVVTSTGTKVFGIHHHMPSGGVDAKIMCWYGGSLVPCTSSYPMLSGVGSEIRATPDFPHGAIWQKKIYYPSARYFGPTSTINQIMELGMGCWDAEADAPCPFVLLPGNPAIITGGSSPGAYTGTLLDGYVTGVRADPANPSRMYVYALDKLYCVDVALPGAPQCAGWTVQTVSPDSSTGRSRDMFVEENGTRLFISNTLPRVFCYELASGATCNGWPATGTTGGATAQTTFLGPGIDSTGVMTAICIVQGFNASNFKCIDIATSAAVNNMWPASMSPRRIFSSYHLPNTTKVLFPAYLGMSGENSQCYDFAANAYCTPFVPYWSNNTNWTDSGGNSQGPVRDYGYAVDPQAPDSCIYGLGDGGTLIRFKPDGSEGQGSCVPKKYTETFSADDQYCFAKPSDATWTNLDILNRPSGLTGGTIVLKDSTGTVLQTITVGSSNTYAMNLSAVGASSAITVEFTPTYAGNTPPTTDYQLRLGYESNEMPQICYKTIIKSCGEVSNHATLTSGEGALEAGVNLGAIVGAECNPGSDCLKLTSTLTALPDGSGVLNINLTGPPSITPTKVNLTVVSGSAVPDQPTVTIGTGMTTASWNLTGLVMGDVVTFKIGAVQTGGGSKPGTDLCCSTTVKHTVGEPDIHSVPPTVVVPPDNPPPPPPLTCEKSSTKLADKECVCRYEGMTRKRATECSCPTGTQLQAGVGCVKKKVLQCDKWSAKLKGEKCQCLYPNMTRLSKTECGCPDSQILVKGVGCVTPKQTDKPKETSKPVTPLQLPDTKTPDAKIPDAPVDCAEGMELKEGKCVKEESSFFGDALKNVHIGVGTGGNGSRSSTPIPKD